MTPSHHPGVMVDRPQPSGGTIGKVTPSVDRR
jgi:hypothetical protein